MAIGTVRPSGISNPQYLSDQGSAAFNHGVGQALQGLSRRLDLEYRDLLATQEAEQERQNKFDAELGWIKEQGSWARGQADVINNAPPGAAGLTDARYATLRERGEAFLSTIKDDKIRDEYRLKMEAQLQNYTTNTYVKEYELRLNFESKEITNAVDDYAERVYLGELDLDTALGEIETLINSSALPETARAAALESVQSNLLSVDFQREINAAVQGQQPVREADGSSSVAPGLNSFESGILNGIADAEAAGYNTLVGGGTFTDFSDHPRQTITITRDGKEIKSTAAGRYQFLASTWDWVAGQLNLKDFSPVNQDRAALWLAEHDYDRRRPEGARSWRAIMFDGTDEEILQIKSVLAGSGMATTWEGLQARWKSDGDFLAVFKGERGVKPGASGSAAVPDVWSDPRYENLSFEDKLKMADTAKAAQKSLIDQQIAQQSAFFDQLQANVALGMAGAEDINQAIIAGEIAVKDIPAAIKLRDEDAAKRDAAQEFMTSVESGVMMVNSADNQEFARQLLKQNGHIAGLQNLKPESAQAVSELFGRSGVVPDNVIELLSNMARSANPQMQLYGMDTLVHMSNRAPNLFASVVDKETAELTGAWELARKYSPQGEDGPALQMVKDFFDPALQQQREASRKIADENLKEFSADDVAGLFDAMSWWTDVKAPASPQASAVLRSDFEKLYRHYFPMFGDDAKTKEFVIKQMSYNWGSSEPVTGNSSLMYLAPTSAVAGYRPVLGSYEWMRTDIIDSFGWEDGQEFELISDGQTEADIANKEPASYLVSYRDASGLWRTKLSEDGVTPLRVRFTIDDDLVQQEVLQQSLAQIEGRIEGLRGVEADMPDFADQPGRSLQQQREAWRAENPDLVAQMEEAERQAEELRRLLRANRLKRNPNAYGAENDPGLMVAP